MGVVEDYNNCADDSKYAYIHELMLKNEASSVLTIMQATKNSPIKLRSMLGLSILHTAAEKNLPTVVKQFIIGGADLGVRSNKGATPLHFAVKNNSSDCVSILLDGGCNVLDKDYYGYNSLDYAKISQSTKTLEILEKYLVDKQLEDNGSYAGLTTEEALTKMSQKNK